MFESVVFVVSSLIFLVSNISGDWVEIVPIFSNKTEFFEVPTTENSIINTPYSDNVDYFITTPDSSLEEVNLPKPKFRHSSNRTVPTRNNENNVTESSITKLKENAGKSNNFLQFLQIVQENLLQYKFDGRKNKLSILKHLRDQLLANIYERITNLWRPNSSTAEARDYKDDDYHMDFPSNEGALMTIGFLTFAVYLIKLVIKLIYALKYKKQYYYMMSTTTTTEATLIFAKRNVNETIAKISQFIDEYKSP